MAVQISEDTARTISQLGLMVNKKTVYKSAAKNKHETSRALLKTLGIKHKPECLKCMINCEVKHEEDIDFWARKENLAPVYTLETCPRKIEVDGKQLKDLKKSTRKRR